MTALAARYESNPAFVSISVAGPTASSEEMILPDNANTPAQDQFGGILPNAMWLKLLAFHYPGRAAYQRSDQAFIDEWEAAIDMYGEIFSGVTLVATTGSGFPNLAAQGLHGPQRLQRRLPQSQHGLRRRDDDSRLLRETHCGRDQRKGSSGGRNGSRARKLGRFNLGVDGIKLVSRSTAQLTAPAAQILGGAQFNSSFTNFTLTEGCTSKFPPNARRQAGGVQHSAHLHHTDVHSRRLHPAGLPRPGRHAGGSGELQAHSRTFPRRT